MEQKGAPVQSFEKKQNKINDTKEPWAIICPGSLQFTILYNKNAGNLSL